MQTTSPQQPPVERLSEPALSEQGLSLVQTSKVRLLIVLCVPIMIAVVVSHVTASRFGLQTGDAMYRRIGTTNGPQVFCAGSSLLQFGISWPEVSDALGQGIECWAVAGSSPEIWEVSQRLATNANTMIMGVSVYDLNEYQLCDSRAHIVSFGQTVSDLWQAKAGWLFSKRVLSQYPLALLRSLIPTAGRSNAVLVGLRRKMRELFGLSASAEDQGNALVLPSQPVLDFGAATERVSNWPVDKVLRRLAMQRNLIQGRHAFDGPKKLAFLRMLNHVRSDRTIVIVLPVAPSYAREFATPEVDRDFENVLSEAKRVNSDVLFVRLDRVSALHSDEYFSDLVHLNGAGREIATAAFFNALKETDSNP